MKDIAYFLLKDKQARILLVLKENDQPLNVSEITKNANVTYVHTCNLIQYYEKTGLVKTEKRGKKKYASLTEKGEKIANKITEIYDILKEGEDKPAAAPANL